jgi:hypothetical protein
VRDNRALGAHGEIRRPSSPPTPVATAALATLAFVLPSGETGLQEAATSRSCVCAGRSRPWAAYDCRFAAFNCSRASVVAPPNATQSLWAVPFPVALYGRKTELIGPRLVAAGMLAVAGAPDQRRGAFDPVRRRASQA